MLRRTGGKASWVEGRDLWYHELVDGQAAQCEPEAMGAEDPLFILYTSGSTGKPKGVLHSTGGYLLAASLTHRYVLDYHDDDVFWCTADVGWVTGHSYIVYGPLANGATTVMFEGVPTCPDASRFWQIIDKHRVSIFYTAPTAIRALIRQGEAPVQEDQPQVAAPARLGRRADQPRGLALVLQRGRRATLPDRRHLVADRDRRHRDRAAAGRHRHQARLGDAAVLRRRAGDRRRERHESSKANARDGCACATAGPECCARCIATTSASCRPTSAPFRACISPATVRGATRTATTGSPAESTT